MTTSTWAVHLEQAAHLSGIDRVRALVDVCVGADWLSHPSRREGHRLPVGRSGMSVVREAARALREGDHPASLTSLTQAVGHVFARWREDTAGGPWRTEMAEAQRLAAATGDQHLLTWILSVAVEESRRRQDRATSYRWALDLRDVLTGLRVDEPSALSDLASRDLLQTRDGAEDHALLLANGFRSVAISCRDVGDVGGWRDAARRRVEPARVLIESRPSALGGALEARAEVERFMDGRADLSELESLADRGHTLRIHWLKAQVGDAQAIGDQSRVVALQAERMAQVMQVNRSARGLTDRPLAEIVSIVRDWPEGPRRDLNSLANGAYETGRALVMSGRTRTDAADRALAETTLDLAAALWSGWGNNGAQAIVMVRAMMRRSEDPAGAHGDLLTVTQRGIRAGLRAIAAYWAATLFDVERERTLDQVETMLQLPWSPNAEVRLRAARLWLLSSARVVDEAALRQDLDWFAAMERPGGPTPQVLDPWARVYWVRALHARSRGDREGMDAALRSALLVVVRRLHTASTSEQRRHDAVTWAPLIDLALTTSESLDDAVLGDLVGEVVRRDGLGVTLAQAARDDDLSTELTQIIRDSLSAESAELASAITDVSSDEPSESAAPPGPDRRPDDQDSADGVRSAIASRQHISRDAAQRFLGALGRLMDPTTVVRSSASDIARRLPASEGPTVILQLLSPRLPLIGGGARVFRRLTVRVGAEVVDDLTDSVDVAAELLSDEDDVVLRSVHHAADLLPDRLRELSAPGAPPVRLHVVPSGLFHVPWEAVPSDGRLLIEWAEISVHTSLAAMEHQLSGSTDSSTTGSIALMGGAGLDVADERRTLSERFPRVIDDGWREALEDAPTARSTSVLALAVHGSDDEDGWDQYKVLPGGGRLTAAEALTLHFPRVCVLASCHSRVRTSAQMDLAGFPTALFARGATTVVGGIGELPDRSTADILCRFYEHLSRDPRPSRALRQAKLDWLADDVGRWRSPTGWARIVAYGGADR